MSAIAELPHYIVLEHYTPIGEAEPAPAGYQSEAALEREFIQDLKRQGYEYCPHITGPQALLQNARLQLQALNNVQFTQEEWQRFVAQYLDAPADHIVEKTRKIQQDHIYDFTFDDGHVQNIYLVDKEDLSRNKLQVINQFEQTGTQDNRYDVTILVNGLPLVHTELKRRGVAVREAFNQIHRYSKESFNSASSLYKYLQIFIISNGTETRYFANTTKRNKNSFDFTINWAQADNTPIRDLKDFTATFLEKQTLLQVLLRYSVFDTSDTLLIMRPYQIAATERILRKLVSAYQAKQWSRPEGGGYVWHTTGSGKTLTGFKAAQLATRLEFIDKVFFVVDRKDLDYQTMREYQRFSPRSVNGSANTAGLKSNLEKKDNRIIVTTIQKLNNLIKSEPHLPVYGQQVVFIFDECHRSQFGQAQKNIQKKFKYYYQIGFTGTPIFPENAYGSDTTASVFGHELHSYVITDAIRDEKVLKFKVDYNNVRPQFKALESEQDVLALSKAETKEMLLHPDRIRTICRYIVDNFRNKTHRNQGGKGFNAMFAVQSVPAAKLYYQELKAMQQTSEHPLRIATIFSFAPNEEQQALGEIQDEELTPGNIDCSAKEFLSMAIEDYNSLFNTAYGVDSEGFQNYYKDLSKRVKNQEIDLIIVVGMFLTGFDAPTLNTLFVDKNLRYHGLLQAFSRTNRIYDATKEFGNIVTFRDLEQATIDAITLFGDKNTKNVILEKSYQEYLNGFTDIITGEARKGYIEVVNELSRAFPQATMPDTDSQKRAFVRLFGEYLRIENILSNYDEFTALNELKEIDQADEAALEAFRQKHFLTPEQLQQMSTVPVLEKRKLQDYKSVYNDIRESRRKNPGAKPAPGEEPATDWDDVVFEVELLRSQEFNLDYILELIFEHNKKQHNKEALIEDIRRLIRSTLGHRAKESLIIDFIEQTNLDAIPDKPSILEAFFTYAQERQKQEAQELIREEELNEKEAKQYLQTALRHGHAGEEGTDLHKLLPKMSPLNPLYLTKKQNVFRKIVHFIEKFKGIGGTL